RLVTNHRPFVNPPFQRQNAFLPGTASILASMQNSANSINSMAAPKPAAVKVLRHGAWRAESTLLCLGRASRRGSVDLKIGFGGAAGRDFELFGAVVPVLGQLLAFGGLFVGAVGGG